jgi:uncharacterized protein YyaL (SSP411 family)
VEKYPQGHCSLLLALDELVVPPEIIILRGETAEAEEWRAELAKLYAPRRIVLSIPSDVSDLPPALADKKPQTGTVAYICRGNVCSEPIDSLSTLVRDLRLGIAPAE